MAAVSRAAWGLFILRVVVGVIFLMHGISKIQGGVVEGVVEVAKGFDALGLPQPLAAAWIAVVLEVVGGALLILGVLTPLWNVLFIIHQLGGIYYVHAPLGFFVVGPGQGGYEFSLLLIAANLCLLLAGAGALAPGRRRRY